MQITWCWFIKAVLVVLLLICDLKGHGNFGPLYQLWINYIYDASFDFFYRFYYLLLLIIFWAQFQSPQFLIFLLYVQNSSANRHCSFVCVFFFFKTAIVQTAAYSLELIRWWFFFCLFVISESFQHCQRYLWSNRATCSSIDCTHLAAHVDGIHCDNWALLSLPMMILNRSSIWVVHQRHSILQINEMDKLGKYSFKDSEWLT